MQQVKDSIPQPFTYHSEKGTIGVLLVHGFTGSTLEWRDMGKYLFDKQYIVHAPLLKGHGTTPEDMNQTTWVDWFVSARDGYHHLIQIGCQHVFVIGLSMGGLLALKLAQYHQIDGIISLCTPIKVRDKRIGIAKYLKYVMPYKTRSRQKEAHIEEKLYVYDKTPLSCVASLERLIQNVNRLLPKIKQPILIVQSERDETVEPLSGAHLYQHVGSKHKELLNFSQSSHIITLDREKNKLYHNIDRFIQHEIKQNRS
jgi:carboxylesterase